MNNNENKKIYNFNERTIDALKRFLYSRNPLSYFANIFFNSLWMIGKIIKKILGKEKIEKPIEQIIEIGNIQKFCLKDIINYSKNILTKSKNTIIFIDLKKEDSDTSGALDYGKQKSLELLKEDNSQLVCLNYCRNTNIWLLKEYNNIEINLDNIDDFEKLFMLMDVKKVFINNLAYLTNPEEFCDKIVYLKNKYNFKLEYGFNDYLSICPSFFLLNKEGKPCHIESDNKCDECLYNSPYRTLVRNSIVAWREKFGNLFEVTDNCVFFSEYTKNIITSVYPLIKEKCTVEPHECLFSVNHTNYKKPKNDGIITVGFVGTFTNLKGSQYYIEVINKLKENNYIVEPIIIGSIDKDLEVDYKQTGKYNRDDLGKLLSDNNVDIVIYPSANNETFSYVAQELMTLNVPFVLFGCGAPKERIIKNNYNLAIISDEISSDGLYDATIELIKKLNI